MHRFISGGCKNGKSLYAQRVARDLAEQKRKQLYYVATMIPTDAEDRQRIRRHIAAREGWGFITLEQGRDICAVLTEERAAHGVFLLDSVTALLSNEMFGPDGSFDPDAGSRVADELCEFVARTEDAVLVSDYIYSDSRQFDTYTEAYRQALALADRRLVAVCDQVTEVTYGFLHQYRGGGAADSEAL